MDKPELGAERTMNNTSASSSSGPRLVILALFAAVAVRAVPVAMAWYSGQPPAYQGQHVSRLLFSMMMLSFLCAALFGSGPDRDSARSRYFSRSFMAVAVVTLLADVWYDYVTH
jgi:hypothetical protein